MTLLDAYALIAVFAGEPAVSDIRPLLRRREVRIAATNLAETYDRLMRLRRMPRAEVDLRVELLKQSAGLAVVEATETIARHAGELRAAHYNRRTAPVSMADCILTATAKSIGASIATPDRALAEMARQAGIPVVGLPNSSGDRP